MIPLFGKHQYVIESSLHPYFCLSRLLGSNSSNVVGKQGFVETGPKLKITRVVIDREGENDLDRVELISFHQRRNCIEIVRRLVNARAFD